jgi:hypothetical protein
MNIIETEDGGKLLTISCLTSDQAANQLSHLSSGYNGIDHLCLERVTMSSLVCKKLTKLLLHPERDWKSLKFVDCPKQAAASDGDSSRGFVQATSSQDESLSRFQAQGNTPPPHHNNPVRITAPIVILTESEILEDAIGVPRLVLQTTSSMAASSCFLPVSSMTKVKSLRICCGAFTQKITEEIEKGLNNTTTLEELSFSGSRNWSPHALESLSRGLAENTSIRSLDFGDALLNDQKMPRLLNNLRHISLQRLDLSNNLIGDQVLHVLANVVLKDCPSLHLLDLCLQRNRLNMTILAPALQQCSSLKILKVANCQMIDEDVIALVDALVEPNASICDLNLSDNRRVTEQSLMYMARRLSDIACLRCLNIRKMAGSKSENVLKAIAEGLAGNTSLLLLRMNYFLCVEHTRQIQYLVNANRGGRHVLGERRLPLGVWPHIFERASNMLYYCPLPQNAKVDAIYILLRSSPSMWE